jgi:3-hydroxyisobutyrate dehydrogenase
MNTVAVLGAGGTMGMGMARNLAKGGIQVRAWNRTFERLDDLSGKENVRRCEGVAEVIDGAEVIITMLSDAGAVISAAQEALPHASVGALWLQTSTIGIDGTERCRELAERHDLVFVDAPVLGTKQPAEEGELVILASGPEQARARLEPVFEAIGKRTMWIGEAGKGSRLKVVINSWIVTVVEGAAETFALAEGAEIDPKLVFDAISDGPLDLPYLRIKGKAMLERDFTPSFRLSLAAKDAELAVDVARSAGLDLPMLEAISVRMVEAAREHGDEDLAATYLLSAPAT